jgi:hypothetical protein
MDIGTPRCFFRPVLLHVTKMEASKACRQRYIDDYIDCFAPKVSPVDSLDSALIVASISCFLGVFSTKKRGKCRHEVSHDNRNHSSLGFYVCLPMTLTGACDTLRHPLLSLDSYCLQIPALCQYSRDQTQFNSIASQIGPTLLCDKKSAAGVAQVDASSYDFVLCYSIMCNRLI